MCILLILALVYIILKSLFYTRQQGRLVIFQTNHVVGRLGVDSFDNLFLTSHRIYAYHATFQR
jgi:hypothetical protein